MIGDAGLRPPSGGKRRRAPHRSSPNRRWLPGILRCLPAQSAPKSLICSPRFLAAMPAGLDCSASGETGHSLPMAYPQAKNAARSGSAVPRAGPSARTRDQVRDHLRLIAEMTREFTASSDYPHGCGFGAGAHHQIHGRRSRVAVPARATTATPWCVRPAMARWTSPA